MKLPQNWKLTTVGKIAEVRGGKRLPKGRELVDYDTGFPYIRVTDMYEGGVKADQIKFVPKDIASSISRYKIFSDELFITVAGTLGIVGEIPAELNGANLTENADKLTNIKINRSFLSSYLQSPFIKKLIAAEQTQNAQPKLAIERIKTFPITIPPKKEQTAIASLLSTWSLAIDKTERLIVAKENQFLWLSGGYLFGGNRLNTKASKKTKWFSVPDHWEIVKIGSIAKEVTDTNEAGENIPVLSCTKYNGLVDSLTYFDKQVFSMDTSSYKVVSRGQFAYATNHIEEGSIGYQDLYDKGLVSPMYTVFETDKSTHDGYLYKILKTETYRHIFQVNTSASVDRRGSLRWNEFAKLPIPLPPLDEQQEISAVLGNAWEEIDLLKKQADAYRKQKRGLMQKLLTGHWRVRTKEENA